MFVVSSKRPLLAGIVVGCVVVAGCGSESTFEFDSLDMAPAQEELSEFSLGEYKIPIPVATDSAQERPERRHRFQLDFQLHALVLPASVARVTAAWERHEGEIRDHVICVCRNATVDELQEPELATLKTRLMGELAPQMGDKEVRQLLITEIVSQPL